MSPTQATRTPDDDERSRDAEYVVRWVLTHDPIALFEEAARHFTDVVWRNSGGRIHVQVSTPVDGRGKRIAAADVAARVADGRLEMSQTYSTVLGHLHEPLWALDLPLLFRDHDHAADVLDGNIGRRLLDGLATHQLRGLAFTYSGGYRIISTTGRRIESIRDLSGARIRTSDNPVVKALFEALGAKPHPASLQDIPALTSIDRIDAAESTWPRYWDMEHFHAQPVINETSHSLFLTTLVVNHQFYNSLPDELQGVLHDAAIEVARLERAKSVADATKARTDAIAMGLAVVPFPPSATDELRVAAATVYERFAPRFGPDLVEQIVAS